MKRQGTGWKLCVCFLAAVVLVTVGGCGAQEDNAPLQNQISDGGESMVEDSESQTADVTRTDMAVEYKEEDMDAAWDPSEATTITLSGSSVSIEGSGASAQGSILTISQAGIYVVTGTLTDGQILIEADKEDTVRLILNGVDITCSDGAAIYAKQADKLILTLADGTENTIEDGVTYTGQVDEEPDAAIFSKDDLTINGTGILRVSGNFNNGIGTKDDLMVISGTIEVTAVNDGLRGRDSIAILDGDITIDAGNDGMKSNHDSDPEKGWIVLDGGCCRITAEHDGIQAQTQLVIHGGEYTITAGDGSENAEKIASTGFMNWQQTAADDTGESYKGLKASAITVTGGTLTIDAADDSVHANGDALLEAGTLYLSSGDDGVHADGNLTINSAVIEISKSYEGLEGASIDITAEQFG